LFLFLLSLLALVAGPLLYLGAGRERSALAALDGFVMVAVTALVLAHIVPEAVHSAGWPAIGLAAIGFVGPSWMEHTLERSARQAHTVALVAALVGLVVHELFDGVALAQPGTGAADSSLAIAVVLHRLPVAVTVWSLLRPSRGAAIAYGVLGAMGSATTAGFFLGESLATWLQAGWLGLFQAFVAGSLLHVIIHRPAPLALPAGGASASWLRWSGAGGIAGLAAVIALSDPHGHFSSIASASFGGAFVILALESAPALLLAFVLAGVVQSVLPSAPLAWLRTGRPLTEALRGMAFGLPLPICSCAVVPLYQTLILRGVPTTAALSFLVATPELGIDAALISLPLLGASLALARLVGAAMVALVVGLLLGRLLESNRPACGDEVARAVADGFWARARAGAHYGFVEIVDHVGPWLVAGIAIAALLQPIFSAEWLHGWPAGIDVLLFALVAMPIYVCASGATPLAAVLIAGGVSPGAAIAFLLAGPATNITTFGVLSRLHGRNAALLFGVAILGLSVGLGVLVNTIVPAIAAGPGGLGGEEAHASWLQIGSLAVLVVVFALSVMRQGPRGFVEQVLDPYGGEDEHEQ
jgi:uncharacterized membrane protein YraQ (UPF0718 family)